MSERDVVCIFGEYDGPVHVELVAKGVEGQEEALDRIVEGLGNGHGGTCEVYPHDGDLMLCVKLHNGVTVTVVIKADRERIEDNAKIEVNGLPE